MPSRVSAARAKAGNLSCLSRARPSSARERIAELAVDPVSAVSTECSVRNSAAATSRLRRPSATSRAIRRSASVSSPREGARPPMRASSARVCSAQSGAPSVSKRASASSSVARAAPRCLARRCVRPSASSVRACWNGSVTAGVLGERPLECGERAVEVASGREQQPATAGEDRERPGPIERAGARLLARQDSLRLVELVRPRRAPRAGRRARAAFPARARSRVAQLRTRVAGVASAAAGSPSESSTNPSTQLNPASPMLMPFGLAWSIAACALARASSIAPRCASMIATGTRRWAHRGRAASSARATSVA